LFKQAEELTTEDTTNPTKEQKRYVKRELHGMEIVKNGGDKPKDEIIHKYSDNGKGQLSEAVLIEENPYFITYIINEAKGKDFIISPPTIPGTTRTLKPPNKQLYAYQPYEFKTVEDPNKYLQRAKEETIDTLYQKIKTQVRLYNDVDEYTLNLLSANIIGSYFQDRFSTVHYLIIVGANGTGKSAFGETFECLGYRPVNVTNTTEAFWFRLFGTTESGQVTIIAEEIDKLDESSQIMAMIKVSYQPNSKVPRMNNDNDRMDFYYPYCIKVMIAEKSPSEDKARGVLDRSFKIKTYKGFPTHKIKEIRNPQGNKQRQKLLDDMNDLRNLLLVYKLKHFKDPYKEVDIGLDGRDEELCKPLLQLFCTLGAREETIKELEETLQHFIDIKNNRKQTSQEAVIYPIIINAISKYGNEIASSQLWNEITESLEGHFDTYTDKDGNEHAKDTSLFYSDDFAKMYMTTTIRMINDKFGSESKHGEHGNVIVFNTSVLKKIGKIYSKTGIIKTKPIPEGTEGTEGSSGVRTGLEVPNNDKIDNNTEESTHNLQENINEPEIKNNEINTPTPQDPSDHSDPSVVKVECEKPTCPYCGDRIDPDPFYGKIHLRFCDKRGSKGEVKQPDSLEHFDGNCTAASAEPILDKLNVSDFTKIQGAQNGDKTTFETDPAIGELLLQNNFLTGHLRMRGRDGGAYPYNYLEFIDNVFGYEANTIEVCSGSIEADFSQNERKKAASTVDINPERKPDLVADGQCLTEIPDNSYSRWRCDPPYNEKTAKEMYNCELPNISKLLAAGARVVKPGSLMFLLCSQNYQYNKNGLKRIGFIYISVVPNNETRILNIYIKQ
jgi:hypothetical protein